MEWLPWSLFFIALAVIVVEGWAGRFWYRTAMDLIQQRDALAVELAACKRTRGKA